MSVTVKKWARKKSPSGGRGAKRRAVKPRPEEKDREERKKIGKSLDMAAFMADFQRDTTSAAYWETKD